MTNGAKHGGGRPPLGDRPMRRVCVTLPTVYLDWALQKGDANLSKGLRLLLEELDERQGADHAGAGPVGGANYPRR